MCRRHLTVAAVLLATVGGRALIAAAPARAQTLVPVCLFGGCEEADHDHAGGGSHPDDPGCVPGATLVCAGKTIVDGVAGAAKDSMAGGLGLVGDTAMSGLTSWVANGASWLVSRVGQMLDRSTRPALGSRWFTRQYRAMIGLAIAIALVMLLCAVIHATVRQDIGMLLRTAFVALPVALCLCFAAVTLVEIALAVTDWMTAEVLSGFRSDTGEFFRDLGNVLSGGSVTGGPMPSFLLFLSGLFLAFLGFMVWLELVMREAAIYVAVAFLPLSFAAMIWQRTAHWCRRLVDGLTAIVLSKFTIAATIALAAAAMAHARRGDGGWTALLGGTAVMLIAALTPWLLLRLIPFAEAATQVGLQRGAMRGAIGSAPGAGTATMVVRLAMAKSFATALAGGGGSAAALPAVPALASLRAPAPIPSAPSAGESRSSGGAAPARATSAPAEGAQPKRPQPGSE
jgi:hypothetical protein